jgi:manganese transport protein
VAEIQDAHNLLNNVLGNKFAPILFAIALIAAGQSSTLTGTLSGQIVMEGYLNLRIQPWLRRLITRMIAIVPAFITIYILGEGATGELLIFSQVILSLQLGFAIIPLIHFTSDKKQMGEFATKKWLRITAWLIAIIIVTLNVKLVIDTLHEWIANAENPLLYYLLIIPIALLFGFILLYITFMPYIKKMKEKNRLAPDGLPDKLAITTQKKYTKIAVTVDFSSSDNKAISQAFFQGGKEAEYVLIHIVETAGARLMDNEIDDLETVKDKENLVQYVLDLTAQGYTVSSKLGFGNPKKSIPEIVNTLQCDLLVMGAHGHRGIKDIIFGTTLDAVRHSVKIPLLIVKNT